MDKAKVSKDKDGNDVVSLTKGVQIIRLKWKDGVKDIVDFSVLTVSPVMAQIQLKRFGRDGITRPEYIPMSDARKYGIEIVESSKQNTQSNIEQTKDKESESSVIIESQDEDSEPKRGRKPKLKSKEENEQISNG